MRFCSAKYTCKNAEYHENEISYAGNENRYGIGLFCEKNFWCFDLESLKK